MMVLKKHHEKMKQSMPRMQAQVCKERIVTLNGMVIAEYLLIKNLLTSAGGTKSYRTVFDRVPLLLAELE